MTAHRSDYKRFKEGKSHFIRSFKLFEKYGADRCMITLIENFPCSSRDELHQREGYFIRNNSCVNKYIPRRTDKEYYEDNKEKINEKNKKYRENNKDKINEKFKCQCGCQYTKGNQARHFKSIKHHDYLNKLKSN